MSSLLSVLSASTMITVMRMLVNILVSKVIAIYGGPTAIIFVSQAQYLVGLFLGITASPNAVSVIKNTAKYGLVNRGPLYALWRVAWVYSIILSILATLALLFFEPLILPLLGDTISSEFFTMVMLISIPINLIGTFLISVYNGAKNYKTYFIIHLFSILGFLFLSNILILSFGKSGIIYTAFLNPLLVGACCVVMYLRQPFARIKDVIKSTATKKDYQEIGKYVSMAIVSIFVGSVSSLYVREILITSFSSYETGLWQTVFRLTDMVSNVFVIGITVQYLPALAETKNAIQMRHVVMSTLKVVFALGIISSYFIYTFREWALVIFTTREFLPAEKYVLLLLIAMVIKLVGWVVGYTLISKGAHRWFIFSEILFSLNLVMMTKISSIYFGLNGASYAIIMNGLMYLVFLGLIFNKVLEMESE